MSLRTKWTLALFLAGALPLVAFGLRNLSILRAGLAVAERSLQVALADQVGDATSALLEAGEEATHRVGRLLTDARIVDDGARLDLARETMARATALGAVAIYGANGALIDAIARPGSTEKPLPNVPPGSAHAAWLPPSYDGGHVTLRYAEAMERDGVLRAWVIGTLSIGVLDARLEQISSNAFDRPDSLVLVDGSLRVLSVGKSGVFVVGDDLHGRDVFASRKLDGSSFHQTFGATMDYDDAHGVATVGTLRTLPSRGWAVFVRRPREEAYAALRSSQQALVTAGVAFIVVTILLGIWLASRTTRPVRTLVALSEAYARRDFAARSTVRTGDELQHLGDAMTSMADSLAASDVEIARRATVESSLSRYLPAEVATAIAEGRRTIALGGERRDVTVLFADVVSFTTFAEGAKPEQVVAFLNELFTVLTEVIFRHGGTVDKFVGDCVMAVFNAPNDQVDHARRAVATAEDMHRFVEASRPLWRETFGVDARLAIGINTGEALVGNLGSETRMEYTAIGDVVNVAARLEALARPGQTLVTADVSSATGEAFSFGSLGQQPIRGKHNTVEILELQ